jgi:hypothetical protein
VVDGITESPDGSLTRCESVCASRNDIYVGRSNGKIDRFVVSSNTRPVIIPTVEYASEIDCGTRRPVSHVCCVGDTFACLSGDSVYVSDRLFSSQPIQLCKGVSAFAVHDDPSSTRPAIVVASTRKRLTIYEYSSKDQKYVTAGSEISLSTDTVTKLIWFNGWVIGCTSKTYFSVSPYGDGVVRDIFPIDQWASIGLIRNSNEVIVTGHDGLGIFLNMHASPYEAPSPAPRNTLAIDQTQEESSLISIGSYFLTIQPTEGDVSVFTLGNDLKQVQSFSLPHSVITPTYFDSQCGVPVIAGPVMYLLVPVPFGTQFKKLVDAKLFSDALELINYQFSDPIEKQKAIQDFHRHLGWSEFRDLNFPLAFLHFNLCGVDSALKEIGELLPLFEQNGAGLKKLLGVESPDLAYATFSQFLQSQRQLVIASGAQFPLERLELMIIDLMNRLAQSGEIEFFLRDDNLHVSAEQVREILANSPAMAAVLEREGKIEAALEILESGSEDGLLRFVNKHSKVIPADKLVSVTARLVSRIPQFSDELYQVITSIPTESALSILTPLMASSALAKECMRRLALTTPVALIEYAKYLSSAGAVIELEELVLSGTPKSLKCISELEQMIPQTPEWTLTRMFLFGLQDDHRSALLVNPQRGAEYIDAMEKRASINRSGMYTTLLGILFEAGEYQKGVDILEAHVSIFEAAPSKVLAVIPTDCPVTPKLITVLNRLNNAIRIAHRKAVVRENLSSYSFLKTYSKWAKSRQFPGTLVTCDSLCGVCNQSFPESITGVFVLPNGTPAHAKCVAENIPAVRQPVE